MSVSRRIERPSAFKKDWKRVTSGKSVKEIAGIESRFVEIVTLLAQDAEIPARYRDHALTGDRIGLRDVHVRPDMVLLYSKYNDGEGVPVLSLIRIGSHSELGL